MAIQALYPSRRQSRWTNPLFLRPRLRQARRFAIVAALFAVAVYGVGRLERAPMQQAPASHISKITTRVASATSVSPKFEPVRNVPLFSNAESAG
jgi:hypothetical protein